MASPLIYAALGGIVPALGWLLFWLREDRQHPEPNRLILRTFLLGMLSVALVIPLQKGVEASLPGLIALPIILWALIEEVFKFLAGYFGGIHTIEDNEPVDVLVYMVTAALGFVAVENTLFILGPLIGHDMTQGLVTGNMRFIGASLLHIVSSGFLGTVLAGAFYKSRMKKIHAFASGLLGAVIIHSVFNLLILQNGERGMMLAFFLVWTGVIALLWTFERVKRIAPNSQGVIIDTNE